MNTYAPFARILLRYLAGAGVTAGALGVEIWMDPDMILIVSMLMGGVVEVFYALAKKHGGST